MSDEISYGWQAKDAGRIRVTAEPSRTQANVCVFVVDPPLYPDGGVHFVRGSDVSDSALATKLFQIEGVTEILIAGNSLTVTMETAPDWNDLSARIAETVRDQIESGEPSVADSFADKLPSPDIIRDKVQEVIDTSVNPAVAAHGGVVTLLDVQGNNIFLEFGGGCQGCGMVSVTLKYGVEKLIRDHVPDVGQILDTTDHAAGQNPYYAPSEK